MRVCLKAFIKRFAFIALVFAVPGINIIAYSEGYNKDKRDDFEEGRFCHSEKIK